MTFDSRAVDHVIKSPRPSLAVFADCKRSKTGGIEGLGMRLIVDGPRVICITRSCDQLGTACIHHDACVCFLTEHGSSSWHSTETKRYSQRKDLSVQACITW